MRSNVRISKRSVDALVGRPGRTILWDGEVRGFGVVVMPSGIKSYIVNYRARDGRYRRMTLGQHGRLTPDEARRIARKHLGEVADGRDPAAERLAQRNETRTQFSAVAEEFIVKHVRKARSTRETERVIRTYLLPPFGRKQIADIKRREISVFLDEMESGRFRAADGRFLGGPVMADRALAVLRKLMNWYAVRDDDFISPIVRGMARTKPKERARDRVLSDDEIRALWAGVDIDRSDDGSRAATLVWSGLVRLLLLTGQRREEVAQMRFSEIDDCGTWTIPAERYKTGRPNIVPLSAAALSIVRAQEKITGSDLVFTTNGLTPFSGFSKAKKRLDVAMLHDLRDFSRLKAIHSLSEWRLHDLRRTARTLMVRAGVRPDVAERVLGHAIPGIAGVYDRYSYLEEKRGALERLAAVVEKIIGGTIIPVCAVTPV